jgi:hypothetical protein
MYHHGQEHSMYEACVMRSHMTPITNGYLRTYSDDIGLDGMTAVKDFARTRQVLRYQVLMGTS